MFRSPDDMIELANGVRMPCLGFGTWQIPNDPAPDNAITRAIANGYRLFDSAQIYGNAAMLGRAVAKSGLPRDAFFLTSKVWGADRSYDGVMSSFEATLEQMQTDYLDLLMIHWPAAQGEPMIWQSQNAGTWRAMEDLCLTGRVRAIGVANFLPHHLVPLLARARIKPMVNQLEVHPGYPQFAALNFCFRQGIPVMGWSPLGRGALLRHPLLTEIAGRLGVTPAQIALRWALLHGVIPLPKSVTDEHQKVNRDIFSFVLSDEDIKRLDTMATAAFSGLHPDTVTF